MTTCRTCKHWEATQASRESSDQYKWSFGCQKILESLTVEIDQGHGWDAGGASLEGIETKPDFGCNKYEPGTYA